MSIYNAIRDVQEMVDNLDHGPQIWAIYAHHSVPWGARYRQHLTDGRLVVWINRGELAEIPTLAMAWVGDGALTGVLGIPVYNL